LANNRAAVIGHPCPHGDLRLGGTGWWIEAEAEIRLPDDRLVVPDLAGWRVERVPALPDDNPIAIVPDWCCEVLSPRTPRDDRVVKLPLHCRSGMQWVWLVDPGLRTVEVFESINGRATLSCTGREAELVSLPPFEGEIDLAPWWPTLDRALYRCAGKPWSARRLASGLSVLKRTMLPAGSRNAQSRTP
jgi:hypothetical protein